MPKQEVVKAESERKTVNKRERESWRSVYIISPRILEKSNEFRTLNDSQRTHKKTDKKKTIPHIERNRSTLREQLCTQVY